ncbi:hypothetical protein [Herbaspirillum chlorophenolicum]|uniref:hypothetical protein n=1 Tax=Herbaspirillum chlorophenolicum TaxID=211589 RepID=UPI000AC08F47|nr:hypothetical protein [Herbaspirillum chlorophenolicum]
MTYAAPLNQKKKSSALLIFTCFLAGCATHNEPQTFADPYGFFSGIWHGIIFPLALLVNIFSWFASLFDISFLSNIEIIGRPNTGTGYYIGFFIGLCIASQSKG